MIATRLARRALADGKAVILWDDGVVTFAFGFAIRGVGRAREPWAIEADLLAGWAFMGGTDRLAQFVPLVARQGRHPAHQRTSPR